MESTTDWHFSILPYAENKRMHDPNIAESDIFI